MEILADVDRLPLFVASDIIIGSTSMYADYIFPDLSFLERWEFQGSHPNIANKVQPVRQPVIAPVPEECEVFGQTFPISLETLLLGLAEQLDLPGFGLDAFGSGRHLTHPDELYLRQVANLAFGEAPDGGQAVPDADDRELELFLNARIHLPASVFDLYQEKTAKTIHAGTGQTYPGLATYVPIQDYTGVEPDAYRDGYDLALITHRVISQTKSRTIADPWLSALLPENGILINPTDLDRLGLRDGQQVKVVSATNQSGEWNIGPDQSQPMIGKLVGTQTLRPGVVSFALGFGHWATGASDVTIDGTTVKGEKRRRAGIHANAAMWTDPVIKNTCMFDPIGGSVSFYDSHVRLEPV